jgi:hypothetical protein
MGKTIVDASAHAGVWHFVLSTGPDCYKLTGGKIKMNAADSVQPRPLPMRCKTKTGQ